MLSRRLAAVVLLGLLTTLSAIADLIPINARKAAPDFTLNDANGTSIKLSKYKGRVVLLDFWATWCEGCKEEIPWYMDFQKKYKTDGLSVLGVSLDEDGWKSVRPFLEKTPINYPIVIGNQDLAERFGVDAMPVTLLIDRDGKIADFHVGMVNKDVFEGEIQVLLKDSGIKKSAT
jgi:cytochrome c biogenesis protein CcmG/thiol:disulfide interchange protein DsbE